MYDHFNVCKQMSSGLFKNVDYKQILYTVYQWRENVRDIRASGMT